MSRRERAGQKIRLGQLRLSNGILLAPEVGWVVITPRDDLRGRCDVGQTVHARPGTLTFRFNLGQATHRGATMLSSTIFRSLHVFFLAFGSGFGVAFGLDGRGSFLLGFFFLVRPILLSRFRRICFDKYFERILIENTFTRPTWTEKIKVRLVKKNGTVLRRSILRGGIVGRFLLEEIGA